MGTAFVELAGNGAAADSLIADGDADFLGIDANAASSDGGEDAAPVGIGARPGGLYQK